MRVECWEPGEFLVAYSDGPRTVLGWTCNGLGLVRFADRFLYGLVHLGSGGTVFWLDASFGRDAVAEVATDIAEACDWRAFDMPESWRQHCPDLPRRISDIISRYPGAIAVPDVPEISPDQVRAFIAARNG